MKEKWILAFVLGLFALGSVISVQAADPTDPTDQVDAASYYYPPSGSSYARCEAFTWCPNGMPIRCWAYGNSYNYTACTWRVVPGAYVECTGYNDWGQWAVSWARCY